MGAYWHLSLPLEICINNNEKSLNAFQVRYGADYLFKENRKDTKRVELSDGFKFTRNSDMNWYVLNDDIFMQEFKPLYKELIETYIAMYQEYKMPSILYNDDLRLNFFKGLEELDLMSIYDAAEVFNQFSQNDGEYFMSYNDWVSENVVYEGYPLVIDDDTSKMKMVTLFYSNFKIGEYFKEFGQLSCFLETVCKSLCSKYRLVKYLALPGF